LARLSELTDLHLGSPQITDETLVTLGTLPSLESLALHNTAVTEGGLEHLRQSSTLEYLDLTWCEEIREEWRREFTSREELLEAGILGERQEVKESKHEAKPTPGASLSNATVTPMKAEQRLEYAAAH